MPTDGCWRRGIAHRLRIAALAACLGAGTAAAADRRFDIPASPLGTAILRLAGQADLAIGLTDPRLASRVGHPVSGRMSVEAALSRLLAGTGCTFVQVGPGAFRIIEAATRSAPPLRITQQSDAGMPQDIIVTASKLSSLLGNYPGTIDILTTASPGEEGRREQGSNAIIAQLPSITSTNLGPGRNKLFIRGIADSSFTGPTQATVGQYLGDVRLTYNAPDPDLLLYDVARVEVLEGPQGTLYGTGALGGIIRIVPAQPVPGITEGSASLGLSDVRSGGLGADGGATLNLPVVGDILTARLVAYGSADPGYIDDLGRGRADINRIRSYGGRATLRYEPESGWIVDAGGALQNINSHDGQYAERDLPPLSRASSVAQPFDNDYALGQVTATKEWGALRLVSATGFVDHNLATKFDATGFQGASGPMVFTDSNRIRLISQETRLSGPAHGGEGWVAGVAAIYAVDRIRRTLGPPGADISIAGVRNENLEVAGFGQYGIALSSAFTATFGGRLSFSQAAGRPLDVADSERLEQKRHELRVLPSLAVGWKVGDRTLIFVHYQEGNRAGGLAIAASGSTSSVQRFETDSIGSVEVGARIGARDTSRVWGSIVGSVAHWEDIQADLVDMQGLPFSANIGDGRILALEAQLNWRPLDALTVTGSLFLTDSGLTKPAPGFAGAKEPELPNVAEGGGRMAASYRRRLSATADFSLDGAVRYVGHSQLGVAPPLNIRQGNYFDTSAGGRIRFGTIGVSLDVTNVLNVRGNRFSYGNPFTVDAGDQTTPLRPRTLRLGVDARF